MIARLMRAACALVLLSTALLAVEPKVVAGDGFFVLLAPDGTVWSWGRNDYGQLGQGGADPGVHAIPARVGTLANVTDIAAGTSHALAITANGQIYGWGRNQRGQLGTGDPGINHPTPTATGFTNFQSIAAGGDHSAALYYTGQVYCWGENSTGQLGLAAGDTTQRSVPTKTDDTNLNSSVIAITAGTNHTMALLANGSVWAWGDNSLGQLGDAQNESQSSVAVQVLGLAFVKEIAAGANHGVALLANGTMRTWGSNARGQCGFVPAIPAFYAKPKNPTYSKKVRRIFAGGDHTTLIDEDGFFASSGANGSGELWTIDTIDRTSFGSTTGGYKAAIPGIDAVVYLKANGQVQAAGANTYGQLGNGTTTPALQPTTCSASWPMQQAIAVVAHNQGGLILKADGTVWSWGYDGAGQLGDDTALMNQYQPVQVAGLSNIIAVAAGSSHCLALANDGIVYSWGSDVYGQLGDDANIANKPTPVLVLFSTTNKASTISAGAFHSGLVTCGGIPYTWGYDFYGQLGNDTNNTSQFTPVQVLGLTDIKSLACGGSHTLALKGDGSVFAWGKDDEGQLGDANGIFETKYTPSAVTGVSGVSVIAAGWINSAVIEGRLRVLSTWGSNKFSQLGLGTSISNCNTPQVVDRFYLDVHLGDYHLMALRYDGNLFACGNDDSGQLGNDSAFISAANFAAVSGVSATVGIAAGGSSSFALQANGTVRAWGAGGIGSLGNNDTTNQPLPIDTDRLWLPILSASASDPTANETSGDTGTWRITTDRTSPGTIPVSFALSGAATISGLDADYSVASAINTTIAAAKTFSAVVLTPIDDQIDEDDELATLTIAPDPIQYRIGTISAANITLGDNDSAGVLVSAISGSTTEAGGSATFTIKLATKPLAPVTIGLSNPRADEGQLSTTSVTLDLTNWLTGVTVTVTGQDDNLDDGDVTYTISTNPATSADAKYNGLNPNDVSVTNIDDDSSGFQISAVVGRATEAFAGTRYFTTSYNNTTKVLQLTSADLSSANAIVGQWVRIIGGTNADRNARIAVIDDVNDRLTLDRSLIADDGVGSIALLPCFAIRLTSKPQSAVTLPIESEDPSEISVFPGSITFDPDNTNSQLWSSFQIVSAYGINEFIDDGNQTRKVILKAATSGDSRYNGLNPADPSIVNVDDDTAGLNITSGVLSVTEGQGGKTYTVALASQPTADVTVTITSSGSGTALTVDTDTSATGNQSTLTFTPANWNAARQVTVTASDDPDIEGNETVSLTHAVSTSTDPNYLSQTATKSITVVSDDAVGFVVTPTTSPANRLLVSEGSQASVQVRLAARPAAGKKVRLVFSLSASASGHATIVSGGDQTWGYADWDMPKSVIISGTEDVDNNNENFALDLTITDNFTSSDNDPKFYAYTSTWLQSQPGIANLRTIDNEISGIAITEVDVANTAVIDGITQVGEAGLNDKYLVSLNTVPAANSVIIVQVSPDAQITVDKNFLVFTSATWNTPQLVTVAAVQDQRIEDETHAGIITHSIYFSDDLTTYPTTISRDLTVQVRDDDRAGVTISPLSVITTENSGSSTFTVVLDAQPAVGKTVRVGLTYQGALPAEAALDVSSVMGGGASDGQNAWIDFSESDWNQARTVIVRGLSDSIDDGDQPYTIATTIASTGTADPAFARLDPSDVSGTNMDVDATGVLLWEASSATNVGQLALSENPSGTPSATYRVRLASKPTGPVTISLQVDSQITVSPAVLTLNPTGSNLWNVPQTITVTAVNDDIAETAEHFGTITAKATGGDYDGIVIANVVARITDNDSAGISVGLPNTALIESGPALVGPQAAFTSTSIAGTVIQLAGGTNLSAVTAGHWLKFSSGPNNGAYVQIIAVDDAIDRITVGAALISDSSATFSIFHSALIATTVSATSSRVQFAAGTGLANLFVGEYVQLSGSSANNGRIVQIATIDDGNDFITVNGTVADGTNETVSFFAGFSVTLNSQPTSNVDLDLASGSAGDVSVFPARLTFTPQNWNQPQVVGGVGVNNALNDGNRTPSILILPALSADPNYSGLTPSAPTVTVLDDDLRGLVITTSGTPLAVSESGTTATFTVQLASQPTADVAVAVTVSDSNQLAVSTSSLIFSALSWSTAQTVTVTGRDADEVDNGAGIAATVNVSIASTTDARYATLGGSSLAVTNFAANSDPTLAAIADQSIVQNGGPLSVNLSDISAGQTGENSTQTLTVTATASPASLLGVPVVTYTSPSTTGTLSIPLIANAFGNGTVTVTVTDDAAIDGTAHSIQQTFAVTVAAVLVDLNGTAPGLNGSGVIFTEGDPEVILAPQAGVDSSRGANLTSLTATVAPIPDGVAESLAVDLADSGLTSTYDATVGTLTLSGSALAASYQQVLRSLRYANSEERPTFTPRTVTVVAHDDLTASLSTQIALTVIPVNDRPVISGTLRLTLPFNNQGTIDATMLGATDVDNDQSALTFSLVTAPNQGVISKNSVALSVGSSFTVDDLANGLLSYQHHGTSTADDVFAVRVFDGTDNSDLQIFTLDISASEAPSLAPTVLAIASNRPRTVTLPIVDPLGRTVTMSLVTPTAAKGTLVLGSAGSTIVTYTPDLDAVGNDQFGLDLVNSNGDRATTVVDVRITNPGEVQPLIMTIGPRAIAVGERYYYEPLVERSGLTGGNLSWELTGDSLTEFAASGGVFSSTTGVINWPTLPTPSDGSGYHRFDLLVIDDVNHVAGYQPLLIQVRPLLTAPAATN